MTLLSRLQSGPPSRELSDEVLISWGWHTEQEPAPHYGTVWVDPNGNGCPPGYWPSPTESVDDALAGVPEGYDIDIKSARHRAGWRVNVWQPDGTVFSADAPTPALAICAAIEKVGQA